MLASWQKGSGQDAVVFGKGEGGTSGAPPLDTSEPFLIV